MAGLLVLLVIVFAIALLDYAALQWGVDSRDGLDEFRPQPWILGLR